MERYGAAVVLGRQYAWPTSLVGIVDTGQDFSNDGAMNVPSEKAQRHIADFIEFVQASPSSFHAAREVARRLVAAGATEIDEADQWPQAPGAYVMRRGGAAAAWIVPQSSVSTSEKSTVDGQAVSGFRIVGSHTDSPGFRIKPQPSVSSAGFAQLAVEVYGGPLLASWTDRELEFAGRVVTRDGAEHLVRTGPVARIPQLAIHFNRGVNNDGLKLHAQSETTPIFAMSTSNTDAHQLIAEAAGVDRAEIVAWDLYSCDTQTPRVFGAKEEFLASGRIDNLLSVHSSLVAFENLLAAGDVGKLSHIPVMIAFDHEEVGSASTTGAAGPLLHDVLSRIAAATGAGVEETQRMYRKSVCLSVDGAHAVHPNYVGEHEPGHHPSLDGGPVIKINANQRYATNAVTQALVETAIAEASARIGEEIPVQYFVSANHKPCGSTIGPITATRLGIDTVDIGAAMLSMHSAREMCGTRDPWWLAELTVSFWQE